MNLVSRFILSLTIHNIENFIIFNNISWLNVGRCIGIKTKSNWNNKNEIKK